MALFQARGKCSWFGGPDDDGVDPDEGLAFIYSYDERPELFLDEQPPGTSGLARRLNPDVRYVACRWDYAVTPKNMLADKRYFALVRAGSIEYMAYPADWGPHIDTGRIADLSPALLEDLCLVTDDEVEVIYPYQQELGMPKIALSSGHGSHVQGAVGIINEVEEARKVVDRVARMIVEGGGSCPTFHDDTSTTQQQNLQTITNWHNAQDRDLDVSMHFNAYQPTSKPMGTETLYVTQSSLAASMASAVAGAGEFINRGAKKRTDLYFLNYTTKPAILIEVCFVDSEADTDSYEDNFEEICTAIALTLCPELTLPGEPPEPEPIEPVRVVDVKIYAPPGVRVDVSINQETEG